MAAQAKMERVRKLQAEILSEGSGMSGSPPDAPVAAGPSLRIARMACTCDEALGSTRPRIVESSFRAIRRLDASLDLFF